MYQLRHAADVSLMVLLAGWQQSAHSSNKETPHRTTGFASLATLHAYFVMHDMPFTLHICYFATAALDSVFLFLQAV